MHKYFRWQVLFEVFLKIFHLRFKMHLKIIQNDFFFFWLYGSWWEPITGKMQFDIISRFLPLTYVSPVKYKFLLKISFYKKLGDCPSFYLLLWLILFKETNISVSVT